LNGACHPPSGAGPGKRSAAACPGRNEGGKGQLDRELELSGRVAVITGGGSGIGRAVSELLCGHGAITVISDLDEKAARAESERISRLGGRTGWVKVDVSSLSQVMAMANRVVDEFGGADILVNCAGIFPPRTLVWEMTEDHWDRIIGINLKGTFLCCQAFSVSMMKRRWGRIINFSSGLGATGASGHAAYSASKGGVVAFTKSLALELAEYGINVNAIAPGLTDTPMPRRALLSEEDLAAWAAGNPLKRIGTPTDMAKMVLFLSSELSSYVTGQTFFVNGGDLMP